MNDLNELKLSICVVSALRNDGKKMPSIQMRLLDGYRYDEILQAGQTSEGCRSFREDFPTILSGVKTEWILWHVDITASRLRLSYLSEKALLDQENFYDRYGIVIVNNPTVIGLKFIKPKVPNGPAMTYELLMSGSNTNEPSHNIRIVETEVSTGNVVELSVFCHSKH